MFWVRTLLNRASPQVAKSAKLIIIEGSKGSLWQMRNFSSGEVWQSEGMIASSDAIFIDVELRAVLTVTKELSNKLGLTK